MVNFCFRVICKWWNVLLYGYQGEAKSASLIGQAIASNPAFITLRKIEAAREIANVMASGNNKTYLNSADLLLNLQGIDVTPGKWKQLVASGQNN